MPHRKLAFVEWLMAVGLVAVLAGMNPSGQSAANTADEHVAAAKAAAGQEHTAVFNNLCAAPAPARAVAPAPRTQPPPAQRQGPPDRSVWYAEPAKVFDNLYYLGQTEYSAWAVTTSAGIIIVDALFDYSANDEIVNGLTKLGLDPMTIKYVIVSHGHIDHAGGARLLQDLTGARVVMSAADWDLIGRNTQAWPKPKRDMIATDAMLLTLGDTTLTLHLTPGHTPGTISTLIPVKDQGRPHVAAEWGGTGFNFTVTPDKPRRFWFEEYARSAERFRDAVTKAGADVLIANHPNQDGAKAKLAALSKRAPGAPHPFVIGSDSVRRYVTMVGECAKAGLARLPPA
ncbi:MAG TPA: MBL fold metallo-hydrolase [Vicinamibacterales bacterium]|nr:MBL fold metallo-hydrolase [Vicinamibacterales bacterium]